MGLFSFLDKKSCDICGGEIGLLGNRKLDDGNCCKDCAKLLSPWMTDRRKQSVADIKDHLAYREANKEKVATFNVTRTLGDHTKVFLDEDAGLWLVSRKAKFQDENPDVLAFSQVTGCDVDVDEDKDEEKREDENGNDVSYDPPRYIYRYDFCVIIHVNTPWFTEIKVPINSSGIEQRYSVEYQEAERKANEIREALTQVRAEARQSAAAAAAPKTSITCPHCGATTIPDAQGRCEYCTGAIGQ